MTEMSPAFPAFLMILFLAFIGITAYFEWRDH